MTETKAQPFRSSNQDEFWMSERIYVTELMNSPEEPNLSLAKFRVLEGVTTQLHSIGVQEWYVIESGTVLMNIDGDTFDVKSGDCFKIEPHQPQQIKNTGIGDLVFQSMCIPRWTPDTYKNLED
ncbi:MAG: cupin domain-containing protein [Hyphomonadaceae bacterium]|nr:cupin domain-containing protein [Hyphomonadaceae bacterium]